MARACPGQGALARRADPGRRARGHAAPDGVCAELARTDEGARVRTRRPIRRNKPAGPHVALTLMSSPVTGASTVRNVLPVDHLRPAHDLAGKPVFRPDPPAIDTLIEAKQRGVDVKIMVPGINNDSWLSRQTASGCMDGCWKREVEVYEYQLTMLHHKTMMVDAIWGHRRHHQLRQPVVRAQRGKQRLLLRPSRWSNRWKPRFGTAACPCLRVDLHGVAGARRGRQRAGVRRAFFRNRCDSREPTIQEGRRLLPSCQQHDARA